MRTLREIVMVGLLRGRFSAQRCPDCSVRAGQRHAASCPTGEWDGGTWA